MPELSPFVEHLLRRAGFGASEDDREQFSRYTYPIAVSVLTNFKPDETEVDSHIGDPAYVRVSPGRAFLPNTNVADARLRWLFRMVHSEAPLQEKMALLWHQHFATAHSKISGIIVTANKANWKPADLAPNINFCLETFGEDRVFFAGDWPVCTLTASYKDWLNALKTIVRDRSPDFHRKLFHDNAVKFYGLG